MLKRGRLDQEMQKMVVRGQPAEDCDEKQATLERLWARGVVEKEGQRTGTP